jgi:hypothetical protein
MSGRCNHGSCSNEDQNLNSPSWRRALWIALAVNTTMFLAEIGAGLQAGSASLQADALDFLGDAANYAVSLGVAGMAIVGVPVSPSRKEQHWSRSACGSLEWRPSTFGPACFRRPRSLASSECWRC